jgi:WD40 repeat protein
MSVAVPADAAVRAHHSPYQGLVPYSEADADWFFGRDEWSAVVADNLRAYRITVLYGASGVGKSSLLHAGMIPALNDEARENVVDHGVRRLLPIAFSAWSLDDPLSALKDTLLAAGEPLEGTLVDVLDQLPLRVGGPVLLVLDQLEELFVYHERSGDTTIEELALLLRRRDPAVHFLLSIREDALADLDRFQGQVAGLGDHLLRLEHLDRGAGREAITAPLELWNRVAAESSGEVDIEPELVEAVLDQVTTGRVSLDDKVAVTNGNHMAGIEAPYLQLVLVHLWDEERKQGSNTLRLETLERLGGAGPIVRTHLDASLGSLSATEQDLAGRTLRFLVTPSGTKIALRTSDLADYAEVPADRLEPLVERLAGPARVLRPAGDGRYEIYHDALAGPIHDWQQRWDDRHRRHRERRRLLFLTSIIIMLVAIVAGVSLLAIWALHQRHTANRAARSATSRELAASAKQALASDPELSLLLSTEAVRDAPTQQAVDSLKQSLLASQVRRAFSAGAGPVNTVAFSPDGRLVLTADPKAARLWDAASGRLLGIFPGHGSPVNGAAFDPGGERVVVARAGGPIEIWSVASRRVVRRLSGDSLGDNEVSFATERNPRWVVSAGLSGTTHVIDARTRRVRATLDVNRIAESAAMSPDGVHVAVGYSTGPTRIWDVSTEKQVLSLPSRDTWTVVYSSEGKRVLTADDDAARIWDADTGRLLAKLAPERTIGIVAAAFSRDGGRVVTADRNGDVEIWDVAGKREISVLRGHTDEVESVAFSNDGHFVVSGSKDGSARIWEVEKARSYTQLGGKGDHFATFSWDGKLALTQGPDGTLSAWPVTREPRPIHVPTGAVVGWAFSPDGERVALRRKSGIEIWRTTDWRRVRALGPKSVGARTIGFSSDNRFLVTANRARFANVWDAASGKLVRRLTCRGGTVWDSSFSPTGMLLAVTCLDEVVVWRAASTSPADWTPLRRFGKTPNPYYAVLFSPHAEFLVIFNSNKTATVMRTDTWRQSSTLGLLLSDGYTFSPRDDLLVAVDDKGAPGAWDLVSGQRLALFDDVRGRVADVSFTSDRGFVLVASRNGAVDRYACDVCGSVDELLTVAEARATRPLTAEERSVFLHEDEPNQRS